MLGYKSVINYYQGNTLYFMVKRISLMLLIEYVKIKYYKFTSGRQLPILTKEVTSHRVFQVSQASDITQCILSTNQEHVIPSFNE